MVRAADAKEVGVEDSAEETCYNPNRHDAMNAFPGCQWLHPRELQELVRSAGFEPKLDGQGGCVCMAA